MELETSGKYIDENGRPIREVLADEYVKQKDKFPYCPTEFFCGSIKEVRDMQIYFREKHPHIRTISATSEDEITLGEIEDMVFADKVDVILTVSRLAQGGDIRPLRGVVRLNASNDPVYKTQGNGRIMRIMKEEDIQRIFAVLRKKKQYAPYSDEELVKNIDKSTENTFIMEPDKWVVFA